MADSPPTLGGVPVHVDPALPVGVFVAYYAVPESEQLRRLFATILKREDVLNFERVAAEMVLHATRLLRVDDDA